MRAGTVVERRTDGSLGEEKNFFTDSTGKAQFSEEGFPGWSQETVNWLTAMYTAQNTKGRRKKNGRL